MTWKEQLKILEQNKHWDEAIEFMQEVIRNNPEDMDAYLCMNYLIMNLLVEEAYDTNKHDYYADLLEKYFDESYAKFSENAEYLYFTGRTGAMSEWFFCIEAEDVENMLQKAMNLDPENLIYQWQRYPLRLDKNNIQDTQNVMLYIKKITQDPSIQKTLELKGSLGEYIWGMMSFWSKRMIKEYEEL